MKRALLLLLFVVFYISSSVSYAGVLATLIFTASPPSTVFYGDTVRIPVRMEVTLQWGAKPDLALNCKQLDIPLGSSIEFTDGDCRLLMDDKITYYASPFICYFNIVIPGDSFKTVAGAIRYSLCKSAPLSNQFFFTPNFSVRVIPHGITMSSLPIQEATANTPFVYNLKTAVKFYDENIRAGFPPYGIVTPAEQDGLRFDQASFSIVGTPKRTGTYLFKVGAQNTYGTAAQVDFRVQVRVNEKDKPVFKQNYPIPGASPGQKYSLNLMELIEPQAGFMETNQISFRIDPNMSHPEWLLISKEHPTFLEGEVPVGEAGKEVEVTLIASSNTGGDCLHPLTIKIPVAIDPSKKPVVNFFKLEKLAGANIYEELSGYISDPAHDPDIQLILEKVEPAATWLKMSSLHPTILEGTVPDDVTGQKYLLTLRAKTSTGGSSEPVTIPLTIKKDPEMAPRFKSDQPILPMLYSGQPYIYDFVANNDIYPEYDQTPYQIKFAKGFTPPSWLRIEDNRLISDAVPDDIGRIIDIKLVIKNVPGGTSGENHLKLRVMK